MDFMFFAGTFGGFYPYMTLCVQYVSTILMMKLNQVKNDRQQLTESKA